MTTPLEQLLVGVGVIFDMDGVIVDSYEPHLESWRMLAREIGAEVTEEQFAGTFGRTSRDIIRTLFGETDNAKVRQYDDRKESLYRDLVRGRLPMMPGVRSLVRTLSAAGARIAIGSSGPRENVELVCSSADLMIFVDARISGADVTHGKPDPEVFIRAANTLGLKPSQCIVVEDAPVGIQAAHAGGMKCICLRSPRSPKGIESADLIVDSLEEITIARLVELFGSEPI